MKNLIIVSLLAVLCGCVTSCSTTARTTKNADGTSTITKQSTFFTSIQGYDDSVDADGAQHTSIANYAVDTQAIIALDNLVTHVLQNAKALALAAGDTNGFGTNSAFAAMLKQQSQSPVRKTDTHYFKR